MFFKDLFCMKSVLVTGITGELGRALIPVFIEKGIPIVCFIRKPEYSYSLDLVKFRVLKADIVNRESIFEYVNELKGKVGVIIHMASSRYQDSKQLCYNVIFKGSKNIYDFAASIQCPRLLYFSSILVDSKSHYGRMKLKTEHALLSLANDTQKKYPRIIVLRPGNIYGPPKLSFIAVVIKMLKEKNKIYYNRIKNSYLWSPIYIQDVIDCVLLLLNKPFNNQMYYLVGAECFSAGALINLITRYIDFPFGNMELNFFQKIFLSARKIIDKLKHSFPDRVYSGKKLRVNYGFVPKMRVAEGIPRTIQWAVHNNK